MNAEAHIRLLMDKAQESLAVAEELLPAHPDFSASRAYYALFYAAEAALLTRGLQFAKHSAVLARFNREFVKNGTLDRRLFKTLQDGFALRNQGDYGLLPLEVEEARRLLTRTRDFLASIRTFLHREGHPPGGPAVPDDAEPA